MRNIKRKVISRIFFVSILLFSFVFLSTRVLADNVSYSNNVFQGVTCGNLESYISNLVELVGYTPVGQNGTLPNTSTKVKNIQIKDESKYLLLLSFNISSSNVFSDCNTVFSTSPVLPVIPPTIYYAFSSGTNGSSTFKLYYDTSLRYFYNYQQACGQGSSAVGTTSYNNCINCIQQNSAQDQSNGVYKYVYTDFGCVDTSTSGIIRFIYQLMVIIGAIISFISMLVGGYMFMTSGGDSDKVQKAKTVLTNAIIGLLVIIFAVVILGTIGTIFGISVISF